MSRMISFLILVGILFVIGFLFYQVMIAFLLPIFLAALLVVMFRPLHRWFLIKCKGRPRLAAALTTAAVMLVVLVPAAMILTSAAIEASSLVGKLGNLELQDKLTAKRQQLGLQNPFPDELNYFDSSFDYLVKETEAGAAAAVDANVLEGLDHSLEEFKQKLQQSDYDTSFEISLKASRRINSASNQKQIQEAANQYFKFKAELLAEEFSRGSLDGKYVIRMKELVAWVVELANPTVEELTRLRRQVFDASLFRTIGGATGSIVLQLVFSTMIIVIAVYFFLADGPAMVSSFMRLSPLDDRHEQELLDEFDRVSRAVVVATLLSAVVQGLLGGIGYWFADVGSVFLLTVLTMVFALIPFVGAAAIWVPVCLYLLFFEERTLAAALLAVYGTAIVSAADNVIKPLVLQGQSNLHPLLALLSVLGGVQALGPIGVLVGPMVVAFLQTVLNILHRELTALEKPADDPPPALDVTEE
jgi:predicted PurR-regulated permease PerM